MGLKGKRGLVLGIANDRSIAWGCSQAFHAAEAELAITYLNEKAEPYVRPLAERVRSPIITPCDLRVPGQLEAVFEQIAKQWGRLDFVLHSVAFAPKEALQSRVIDCPRDGFLLAADISCYSLIHLAHLAEPLMTAGGAILTVTFIGSNRVLEGYNIMGPLKATLESIVIYLAAELGPKAIRVHALSPGPIPTRATTGIAAFDEFRQRIDERSPLPGRPGIDDVGQFAAFLLSDAAKKITGGVHYVDCGYHLMG